MIPSEMKVAIRRSPWRLAVVVGVTGLTVLTGGSLQAAVPGTATVSGTVTASQPFQAAQVYIRNLDKGIVYMVYTQGGRFRAVALFPATTRSAPAPSISSRTSGLLLSRRGTPPR